MPPPQSTGQNMESHLPSFSLILCCTPLVPAGDPSSLSSALVNRSLGSSLYALRTASHKTRRPCSEGQTKARSGWGEVAQRSNNEVWALTQYFYHRCSPSQLSEGLFFPHDFIQQGLKFYTKRLEWLLQGVYFTVLLRNVNNLGK